MTRLASTWPLSLALPLVWVATVALSGANDIRFIGVGTDEFRRVLNAGAFLIAAVAILSYAFKAELARGYVVIALPSLTAFDLLARFALRRHLHRARSRGHCMRRVVVVGHALVVADIVDRAAPGDLSRPDRGRRVRG